MILIKEQLISSIWRREEPSFLGHAVCPEELGGQTQGHGISNVAWFSTRYGIGHIPYPTCRVTLELVGIDGNYSSTQVVLE